ncbi:MAG: FAD-binding protein, partial [Chloroflexota bacterium]
PYYCVHPVWATLNCTLGGPQITARTQVLSLENAPIPGLYAAGEMVGGFYFGRNYLTEGGATYYAGNYLQTTASLATCLVFGRIAGKEAAAQAMLVASPPG